MAPGIVSVASITIRCCGGMKLLCSRVSITLYLPTSLPVAIQGQSQVAHFCTTSDSLRPVGSAVIASHYAVHRQLCYTSALLPLSDPGKVPAFPVDGDT